MYTNVNLAAPLGALAFLGTGFLLALSLVALVISLIVRKPARAKFALYIIVAIAGVYLASVLIFSLISHEKLLARGEEKHFCELDCHLAYSIVDARQASTLEGQPSEPASRRSYAVVTIKTRFDETTIGPSRGNGQLFPNSRVLTLIDDHGERYAPTSQNGTPLSAPLRPGQSYTTDVVFALPATAKPASLLISEGAWETHLIIGHENSPLHKKTAFQI